MAVLLLLVVVVSTVVCETVGSPFGRVEVSPGLFCVSLEENILWIDGDGTSVLEGYNEKEKLKQIVLFDHQIRGREMFLSYDKTVCVICKLKIKNRGSPQYSFGSQRKSIFLLGKIFFYCGFSYTLNINNPLVDIHIVKGENKKFSHLKHES